MVCMAQRSAPPSIVLQPAIIKKNTKGKNSTGARRCLYCGEHWKVSSRSFVCCLKCMKREFVTPLALPPTGKADGGDGKVSIGKLGAAASKGDGPRCYNCGKEGHKSAECRSRGEVRRGRSRGSRDRKGDARRWVARSVDDSVSDLRGAMDALEEKREECLQELRDCVTEVPDKKHEPEPLTEPASMTPSVIMWESLPVVAPDFPFVDTILGLPASCGRLFRDIFSSWASRGVGVAVAALLGWNRDQANVYIKRGFGYLARGVKWCSEQSNINFDMGMKALTVSLVVGGAAYCLARRCGLFGHTNDRKGLQYKMRILDIGSMPGDSRPDYMRVLDLKHQGRLVEVEVTVKVPFSIDYTPMVPRHITEYVAEGPGAKMAFRAGPVDRYMVETSYKTKHYGSFLFPWLTWPATLLGLGREPIHKIRTRFIADHEMASQVCHQCSINPNSDRTDMKERLMWKIERLCSVDLDRGDLERMLLPNTANYSLLLLDYNRAKYGWVGRALQF